MRNFKFMLVGTNTRSN